MTNIALDFVRRREVRQRREAASDMAEKQVERPEDRASAGELAAALSDALAELPATMRAALWLHVAADMGVRDVAGCLTLTAEKRGYVTARSELSDLSEPVRVTLEEAGGLRVRSRWIDNVSRKSRRRSAAALSSVESSTNGERRSVA